MVHNIFNACKYNVLIGALLYFFQFGRTFCWFLPPGLFCRVHWLLFLPTTVARRPLKEPFIYRIWIGHSWIEITGWEDSELGKALLLLEASISGTFFSLSFERHTLARYPTFWQLWHVAFFAGHCSRGWGPQPQFLQVGALPHRLPFWVRFVQPAACDWSLWFGLLFSGVTGCTSTAVFSSWSCLSHGSSAFTISLALFNERLFPFLKKSFLTRSWRVHAKHQKTKKKWTLNDGNFL